MSSPTSPRRVWRSVNDRTLRAYRERQELVRHLDSAIALLDYGCTNNGTPFVAEGLLYQLPASALTILDAVNESLSEMEVSR